MKEPGERLTSASVLAIVRRFDKSETVRVMNAAATQSGFGSWQFEQAEPQLRQEG
jgi:hypothetical protein